MNKDHVVAIGFLTQHDLDMLGHSFRRIVPLADDDLFGDLLARLDHVQAVPAGRGMMIEPTDEGTTGNEG